MTRYDRRLARTLLAAISCAMLAPGAEEQSHGRVINAAAILLDASADPPADNAPWQPQSLPDRWNHTRPGEGGFGWYRASFTLKVVEGSYGVFIGRASMNSAVYINSLLVGSGGSFEEPVARNWNRPSFYVIPPYLLRVGENIVHVRLRAYPRTQSGLSAIRIGAERVLRDRFEHELFTAITLNQVASLFTLALGFLFLAFWLRRRTEPMYLYFGLAMMMFAMHGLNLFVRVSPVPVYYWELFSSLTIPLFTALLTPFVLGFTARSMPYATRAAAGAVVLLIVAHAVCGPAWFHLIDMAGTAVSASVSVVLLTLLFLDAISRPNSYRVLIVLASLVCMALALHDALLQSTLLDYESRHLLQFGAPLLSLGMGGELVDRFVRALGATEQAKIELEARVRQKTGELEANYARLAELNREQAVFGERQRIMRDMHDGIGGQLITAIARVRSGKLERGEVEELLREVLDDLRLVIDSMEPEDGDAVSALGNLRYRIEPRLAIAGIRLIWRIENLPALFFHPGDILHTLRIIQEAITNIVKHSSATAIRVTSGLATRNGAARAYLSVSDNGNGYRPKRMGRGIANMRQRACALGGELDICASEVDPGTQVILWLPYPLSRSA